MDIKKVSLDKIKKKQVSNDWLLLAVETERTKQVEIIKGMDKEDRDKYNALPSMLFNIFDKAENEHPSKYVSVSQIAKCVNLNRDEELSKVIISRNIQAIRKKFRDDKKMLANRPRYGYRLGVDKDLPFEAVKRIESSLGLLISSMLVIAKTEYDPNKFSENDRRMIKMCVDLTKSVYSRFEEFNDSEFKNRFMEKSRKDMKELKSYLDGIYSSVDF